MCMWVIRVGNKNTIFSGTVLLRNSIFQLRTEFYTLLSVKSRVWVYSTFLIKYQLDSEWGTETTNVFDSLMNEKKVLLLFSCWCCCVVTGERDLRRPLLAGLELLEDLAEDFAEDLSLSLDDWRTQNSSALGTGCLSNFRATTFTFIGWLLVWVMVPPPPPPTLAGLIFWELDRTFWLFRLDCELLLLLWFDCCIAAFALMLDVLEEVFRRLFREAINSYSLFRYMSTLSCTSSRRHGTTACSRHGSLAELWNLLVETVFSALP